MHPMVRLLRGIGIAVIATAAALGLRLAFNPILGDEFPYLFFFLSIIVSAWFGGFSSGVLSTLMSGIAVLYFYGHPAGEFRFSEARDQVALLLFLAVGTLISMITANLREVAARARRSAAEAWQREEEYRSFFELSAVGAAEHMPPEGRFTRVNQKLVELTGYSEQELLGMSISSITHQDDRPADIQTYKKLLSGEIPFSTIEKRILRKNGEVIWVISTRTAVRDASGKLLRTVAVIQDVTARHRAEDAQRFLISASTILGSSLDPAETLDAVGDLCVGSLCQWCTIILVEADGSLRRAAAAHRDPAKRILVRELTEKHPPNRDHQQEIVHVIESGQPVLRNEIPEPVRKRIEATPEMHDTLEELGMGAYIAVPLTSRGRTLGALTLVAPPGRTYDDFDLSVARELGLRAALAIDNATLFRDSELANRSKDEFFATVSHELKTPMTTILGWSQMLRAERLDEATTRMALESIYRSSLAQAKIIDDILDVARISTGKLALESAPVDLSALLEGVFHAMKPAAEAGRVRLGYQDDACESSTVIIGDATRLQQIFINLLSNAIKFTPPGGEVSLTLTKRPGSAVIVVADTGIGISSDFLPHIFDAFRQAQHAHSKGLGLGLTIAQRLVQSHGGTIEAHSDGHAKGSRFTVTFPLAAEESAVS